MFKNWRTWLIFPYWLVILPLFLLHAFVKILDITLTHIALVTRKPFVWWRKSLIIESDG